MPYNSASWVARWANQMPCAWAADMAIRHAVTASAARNLFIRVTDMKRFTDRTPAPFLVAIADDAKSIVKRPDATCYFGEAAGKDSLKAGCKRQIVWRCKMS